MLASRSLKPKLSLSINTAAAIPTPVSSLRPSLSLKSPLAPIASPLQSPMSPLPQSPTSRNTKLNQRGFQTFQQTPTYAYANNNTARGILKKSSMSSSTSSSPASARTRRAQLQFSESPIVYSVTPIEEPDYYGGYKKMTRDERRWLQR